MKVLPVVTTEDEIEVKATVTKASSTTATTALEPLHADDTEPV